MLNREKWKNRQRSKKENYENNIYAEKWNVGVGDFFLANNPYLTGFLSLNCDCFALRDSELSKLQYKCFAPMGFTTSTNRPKHSVGFTCDYWQVRALITSLRHRSSTEWVTECGNVCVRVCFRAHPVIEWNSNENSNRGIHKSDVYTLNAHFNN